MTGFTRLKVRLLGSSLGSLGNAVLMRSASTRDYCVLSRQERSDWLLRKGRRALRLYKTLDIDTKCAASFFV